MNTQATNDDESEHDFVDIANLIEDCAQSLSHEDPFLCNLDAFQLSDAMAATQLLDAKMDSCQVTAVHAAPLALAVLSDRMLAPRPPPTGLNDPFLPLPFDNLQLQDTAEILIEILIRIQALFSASSVLESTFTCLYAHAPVVEGMQAILFPGESFDEDAASSRVDRAPQLAVYASTLALLDITEIFRGIVMNADIYEEEDFVHTTYDFVISTARPACGTQHVLQLALQALERCNESEISEKQAIKSVLEIQAGMMKACTGLAQLEAHQLRTTIAGVRSDVKSTVVDIERLKVFIAVDPHDSVPTILLHTFDSYVNRPLLGNIPVRKIVFRPRLESLTLLAGIIHELDWVVCNLLQRGVSLGRIERMLDHIANKDVNILSRSLVVLNLYFAEKVLGQLPLRQLLVAQMKQHMNVPSTLMDNEHIQDFLTHLAKPSYDNLKLRTMNLNRQRSYIEAIMLPDWSTRQNEAHYVDASYRRDLDRDGSTPPFFSQYVLATMLQLMDRHVACGLRVKLFCGHFEIAIAFWYRVFLLSALLTNRSMMRQAREQMTKTNADPKKTSKKNKKIKAVDGKSQEDLEDEFEIVVLSVKRMLCRGIVRFIASLRQANFLGDPIYEFTSLRRIFEKRFEVFHKISPPPPLIFDDYITGSDFAGIPHDELVQSTADLFQTCKTAVDRLMASASSLDPDYSPMHEPEIRKLIKVCVGNSVYVRKLKQLVQHSQPIEIDFDFSAHEEFCIIKLTSL